MKNEQIERELAAERRAAAIAAMRARLLAQRVER